MIHKNFETVTKLQLFWIEHFESRSGSKLFDRKMFNAKGDVPVLWIRGGTQMGTALIVCWLEYNIGIVNQHPIICLPHCNCIFEAKDDLLFSRDDLEELFANWSLKESILQNHIKRIDKNSKVIFHKANEHFFSEEKKKWNQAGSGGICTTNSVKTVSGGLYGQGKSRRH